MDKLPRPVNCAMAVVTLLGLVCCQSPSSQPSYNGGIDAAPNRESLLHDQQKAYFARRQLKSGVPPSLQKSAIDYIVGRLRDPDSARLRFDFVSSLRTSLAVCGAVNAKNGFGGYAGFQRFYVEFVDGLPVSGAILSISGSSDRLVDVCGFPDDNDESRSAGSPT